MIFVFFSFRLEEKLYRFDVGSAYLFCFVERSENINENAHSTDEEEEENQISFHYVYRSNMLCMCVIEHWKKKKLTKQ